MEHIVEKGLKQKINYNKNDPKKCNVIHDNDSQPKQLLISKNY